AALAAGGDSTVRQSVLDIVRGRAWPPRYTGRVLENDMVRQWRGREDELRGARNSEMERYKTAADGGDATIAATIVGEAAGLITSIEPAADILDSMVRQAQERLNAAFKMMH